MDFAAPHAAFTLVAYLVSGAALVALTTATLLRQRRLRRRLAERERPRDIPGEAQ